MDLIICMTGHAYLLGMSQSAQQCNACMNTHVQIMKVAQRLQRPKPKMTVNKELKKSPEDPQWAIKYAFCYFRIKKERKKKRKICMYSSSMSAFHTTITSTTCWHAIKTCVCFIMHVSIGHQLTIRKHLCGYFLIVMVIITVWLNSLSFKCTCMDIFSFICQLSYCIIKQKGAKDCISYNNMASAFYIP